MCSWVVILALFAVFSTPFPCSAADPAPEFLLEWGKAGDAPGEFHSPIGLAFNSRDELYVTDLNNARVQKFSTEGRLLGAFDLPRDKPERKSAIVGGIAIDSDDLIYLTNMVLHNVRVYRDSGELVREWSANGAEAGQLSQPGGIIITPDGHLLIADQGNHRLQKFTKTGESLGHWGSYGEGPGEFGGLGNRGSRFGGPHFVARDSLGRLYTTEGFQGRVQQFSAEGKFLRMWGDKTDEPGGFGGYLLGGLKVSVGPIGVAVDRHDRILVSSLNNRVQYFDDQGRFLFALKGTGKPNDDFVHPHGMAFDRAGHLYIADAGMQRIVKFQIPPPQKASP